jgi:hypothetical protein
MQHSPRKGNHLILTYFSKGVPLCCSALRPAVVSVTKSAIWSSRLARRLRNLVRFVLARPPHPPHLIIVGAEKTHDTKIEIRSISLVLTQEEFQDR